MPLLTTFGAGSVRGLGRAARLVPPGAPTSFLATGRTRTDGGGGATVQFTAPVDNGGAPITSYQVENMSTGAVSTVGGTNSIVSLSNNTENTFRVRAVNAAGPGAWSNTDTAFTGYWTYSPGNNGGSTSFSVPSGVTQIQYLILGNGGATSKPDTRVYANQYPRAGIDWWGPETIGYWADFGVQYWWDYHRQYDYSGWWNYDPNWNYMYGYIQHAWGNIQQGSYEYYYMYTYNSGPTWSANTHYGWAYISPYAQSVVVSGSAPQGPTSGLGSSISVPNWGTDSTSPGYGGTQYTSSGTANVTQGTNITVSIGYSNGEFNYSTPGYAVIGYGR